MLLKQNNSSLDGVPLPNHIDAEDVPNIIKEELDSNEIAQRNYVEQNNYL